MSDRKTPQQPGAGDDDRYSRQILFEPIGRAGRDKIAAARVVVVGCGALGTHAAEHLARAGVGSLRLVDRDVVEWSNLERQIGFRETDAREQRPKAQALHDHLAGVNSAVTIDAQAVEFHYRNALDLTAGCDLIVDGTDNLPTRFLINDVSFRLGVPWIYAGVVQARGIVQAFSGASGPCLRCTLPELPPPGTLETCDTAGVLGPAVGAVSGWQTTLALRILVEGPADVAGRQIRLAPWDLDARIATVEADPDCPVCVHRRFDYLAGTQSDRATILCGRRAVHVRPAPAGSSAGEAADSVDLRRLADRLAVLGPVEDREFFLRVQARDFTLTVFPDGRAIFDGLTDEARARSLYARFVGD